MVDQFYMCDVGLSLLSTYVLSGRCVADPRGVVRSFILVVFREFLGCWIFGFWVFRHF